MEKKKKVLTGALVSMGVLGAVNVVRAAKFVPEKRNSEPLPVEKVNVERFIKNLSDAIKIPTIANSDPEKTDWSTFECFHTFLKERYPLCFEKLDVKIFSRASLMFRWQGSRSDLDPIALLSHMDVVPISDGTMGDWKNPPFDGVFDGEFIWGRGALDMKNHLIGVMESVEMLLAEDFKPERDIYLCFGQDEEVMSSENSGAVCMANYFKEQGIHLDSIIDEGGAILPVKVSGVMNSYLAGIGIAEKGYADFEIAISAKGGHSSQPPKHTAIGELADVIKDIENHQFKASLSPMMVELFTKIGKNVSFPARLITCNIPYLKPIITKAMTLLPPAACMVRTTTGITMAAGSPAPNVLPQKASINVNFRMFPGTTVEDVEAHLRKVIRNKNVEITLRPGWKNPSKISPTDSRCFGILDDICYSMNKKSIIAPYLVMGGTDACRYEAVCENIYRYSPFLVNTGLLLTTHGTNERLPVSSVPDALSFFKRYIKAASAE